MSSRKRSRSGNPALRAQSTGLKIEAKHKYHAPMAPPPAGVHQWVVVAAWVVKNPGGEQYNLDTENLLSIEGPGCLICEEPYTQELAAMRCPGEPR